MVMNEHRYVDVAHVDGCGDCGQDANAPVHGATQNVDDVEEMGALHFADYARQIGAVCRDLGLSIPAFRSPPREPDVDRALTRYPTSVTVAVRMRGRRAIDVKRDMADGACEANGLHHDHPKRWELLDRMELT